MFVTPLVLPLLPTPFLLLCQFNPFYLLGNPLLVVRMLVHSWPWLVVYWIPPPFPILPFRPLTVPFSSCYMPLWDDITISTAHSLIHYLHFIFHSWNIQPCLYKNKFYYIFIVRTKNLLRSPLYIVPFSFPCRVIGGGGGGGEGGGSPVYIFPLLFAWVWQCLVTHSQVFPKAG